jgi:hypothetical protein
MDVREEGVTICADKVATEQIGLLRDAFAQAGIDVTTVACQRPRLSIDEIWIGSKPGRER